MNRFYPNLPDRFIDIEMLIIRCGKHTAILLRKPGFRLIPSLNCSVLLFILILLLSGINKASAQQLESVTRQKPVKISGSVNLNVGYYNTNDGSARLKPFNWFLTGSPVITLFGISFPFSMTAGDQNTSFTQPFNQYGASPSYRWSTLHVGYRSVFFSNYTLAGAPFLGAGIEANPGKLRLGFIKGRFQKAVADTGLIAYRAIPAYERWGYGIKLGWGTSKNYVDLIAFKAKDKINSLPAAPQNSAVTPQENISAGLKSAVTFKKIELQLDAALSALTRDMNDKEAAPKDNRWTLLKKLFKSNSTTISRLAGEASGGYVANKWGIRVSYKRIEPDFGSLGAYYFQSDVQQLTLNPSLRLLKKKLRISSSFGFQQDDLLHTRNYRTKRAITTLSVNYNHNPFISGGINFSNYGTSRQSGRLQLNDSIRLSLVSLSYGGYISLNKFRASRTWSLGINITKNEFLDNNIVTKAFTQTKALLSNLSFSCSFIPKQFSFNSTLSANYFRSAGDTSLYWGPNAGFNYTLLKNKLTTSLNSTLTFKKSAGKANEHLLYLNGGLNYMLQRHSIGLTILLSKNTGNITNSIYSLNEQQINLSYGYTF